MATKPRPGIPDFPNPEVFEKISQEGRDWLFQLYTQIQEMERRIEELENP